MKACQSGSILTYGLSSELNRSHQEIAEPESAWVGASDGPSVTFWASMAGGQDRARGVAHEQGNQSDSCHTHRTID